jgi:LuxR family maltose regulon positive regulatory protein
MRPAPPWRPARHLGDDRAVGVTAGAAEVVISTKLFRPDPRHQTVERTRLHELLRQGCSLPLTLVVAPAGWGKSTLVADWLRQDRVTAGWVSLDGGDDDPHRFWRYLLLAAGQAGPGAGTAALRRLDAAKSDVLRDVLPTFINEVASSGAPLVLVLDDYEAAYITGQTLFVDGGLTLYPSFETTWSSE